VRVDVMLEVEGDVASAEPLEAGIAGGEDVQAVAADPEPLAVEAADVPELGRDDDLVAAPLDRPADELLVRERPVHVGRVQEVDPELERAPDRPEPFALIRGPVELGHAHAAEADGRGL